MTPLWVVLAFLVAAAQAGTVLVNEYFKVRPIHLLWWMRLVSFLALIPVLYLFPWPQDKLYILYVFLGALIFAWVDLYIIGLAANSGAGVVTRLEPLIVIAAFLLWTAITPALALDYMRTPVRTAGIVAALTGCVFFALRLKHCEITRRALKTMAPVILLSAVGIALGKMAMNRLPPPDGVYYYAFLQAGFVLAFYMLMMLPGTSRFVPHLDLDSKLFAHRTIVAGLCISTTWLLATPTKWYAISLVENPAYVSVIGQTAPLWVLLAYWLSGRREKANIRDGLGLVACAVILIIFSQKW